MGGTVEEGVRAAMLATSSPAVLRLLPHPGWLSQS